jgi:predicted kinase
LEKKMTEALRNLIIMRGLPGSGKSHAAKQFMAIQSTFSTDNFFTVDGVYQFDSAMIGEAHAQTQRLVKLSMTRKAPLIVVDNTNIRLWEMKPYVKMAQDYNYKVSFSYPDTHWANCPLECAKRNSHGVPLETIVRMHNSFEHFRSLDDILNAASPIPRGAT